MVIKDAKVVSENGIEVYDIKYENNQIEKIEDAKEYDAKELYILPGLIDLNVKLCDDKVNVQNIQKLSNSAIKGGVTTVVLNPDMNPPIDNEIIIEFIKSQNEMLFNITILPLLKAYKDEKTLSEIAILLKKGAVAPFFYSDIDSFLIARIFEYAKMYGVVLHCRARNSSIKSVGVMHEGKVSSKLGLPGISEIEEISEVSKIIEFARFYNVEVLFKSISHYRSLELIKKAKEEGVKVYSEVSIEHLLKNDEECLGYNTKAKIDPPLRDEENRKILIEYLKNGYIDILTSLHSPKSTVEKDISFDEAAYGVDSISSYLKDLYENFVKADILDFSTLLKLTFYNPAKLIGIKDVNYIAFDGERVL